MDFQPKYSLWQQSAHTNQKENLAEPSKIRSLRAYAN